MLLSKSLSVSFSNLCQNSNLNLPLMQQHLHIKSEPASPPRDRSVGMVNTALGGATAGYLGGGHGPNDSGRSPGDSASSCGSSYEGSEEHEDHHGSDNFLLRPLSSHEESHSPSVKRMRLSEGWATWWSRPPEEKRVLVKLPYSVILNIIIFFLYCVSVLYV